METLTEDGWEQCSFGDEYTDDPQTAIGKKVKAIMDAMIAKAEAG